MFSICNLLHFITNKLVNTNLFEPYRSCGMLIISICGLNIQYFSFRAFSQLFQTVPINLNYSYNLVLTYFLLLIIIIYSLNCTLIFKFIYSDNYKNIFRGTFESENIFCFATFNTLKLLTGFIHAYFYYNSFLQSIFLMIAYSLKLGVYAF